MTRTNRVLSWWMVSAVGGLVVLVVLGLQLFPRLGDANTLIDTAAPAFTPERVTGDRSAINTVSAAVDLTDPVMTDQGGAAAEVPKLIAFVAQKTRLPPASILEVLQSKFPHTTNLLQAIPFSGVTAELPGLVKFLATALKMTPDQVMAAIKANFPHLAQAIAALPTVTNGWDNVPNLTLTRFDGTPVHTVPRIRDYFSGDVIPVVERQQGNFRALAGSGGVGYLPLLLLILGVVVILFGLLLVSFNRRKRPLPTAVDSAAWGVVIVVGVGVVALVLGGSFFPRLTGGQDLLTDLRPAFTQERVTGDRVAINMVSSVVDLADPVVTEQGGASTEVPKLVAFVSQQTGLAPTAVLGALSTNFPHTAALLGAIPLSSVSRELPGLMDFLATTLKVTPGALSAALKSSFPHLAQAIAALPTVTAAWNDVPNLTLTRFNGTPVHTVPQIRDYFGQDVVPVLETERANYQKVDTTWPPLPIFPPLLLIVGAVVIVYGAVMLLFIRRTGTKDVVPRREIVGART